MPTRQIPHQTVANGHRSVPPSVEATTATTIISARFGRMSAVKSDALKERLTKISP
jgi:hypothetical protein